MVRAAAASLGSDERPDVPLQALRRPISIAGRHRITRAERAGFVDLPPGWDADRPRTRGDCKDGPRPCPWAGCRYHLYIDVRPGDGSLKLNFPGVDLADMQETCALDVAEKHSGLFPEQIAELLNVTEPAARLIVNSALAAEADALTAAGMTAEDATPAPRPVHHLAEGEDTDDGLDPGDLDVLKRALRARETKGAARHPWSARRRRSGQPKAA